MDKTREQIEDLISERLSEYGCDNIRREFYLSITSDLILTAIKRGEIDGVISQEAQFVNAFWLTGFGIMVGFGLGWWLT